MDWYNTAKNFLDKTVSIEDSEEFINGVTSNFSADGGWAFAFNDDINHLHMNWRFRSSDECVLVSFLIPYFRRAFEGKDHTKEVNQIMLAHFLCRFICVIPTIDDANRLEEPSILSESPYNTILDLLEELQVFNKNIKVDNKIFISIQQNSLLSCNTIQETEKLRDRLQQFADKLKHIQHYCFHSKITCLSKIMGKLLTRIWWIYHTSSPTMKQMFQYVEANSDSDESI
jgi:hypothetical protein